MACLAHISDLHFGRLGARRLAARLLASLREIRPDAVVVSGDIVDWGECTPMWHPAVDFLSQIETPLLVVPGNHDIARLFLWQRARRPFRNFAAFVRPPQDQVLHLNDATVVGLTTPRRWTAELGHVSFSQLQLCGELFAAAPQSHLRAVVLHHGLAQLSPLPWRDCVRGRRRAVWAFGEMGTHIVMSGHNHYPHVALLGHPDRRFIWSQAGTAGAGRLRVWRRRPRSFSVVRSDPERIQIQWWYFDPRRGTFAPHHEKEEFGRLSLGRRCV